MKRLASGSLTLGGALLAMVACGPAPKEKGPPVTVVEVAESPNPRGQPLEIAESPAEVAAEPERREATPTIASVEEAPSHPCCGGRRHNERCMYSPEQDKELHAQPFAEGPDFHFRRGPGKVQTKLLARDALAARVSPDGKTVLVVSQGQGAWLIPGGVVAGDEVSSSRFSPDGRYLALGLPKERVAIVDVSRTRTVRLLRDASRAVFRGDGTVLYRRGCRLMQATIESLDPPRQVGWSACGSVLHADPDPSRWALVYSLPSRWGTFTAYRSVWGVDFERGRWTALMEHDVYTSFISPLTTVAGERTCATRVDMVSHPGGGPAASFVLECRDRSKPGPERIWVEDTSRLHDFDDQGRQLLFEGTIRGRRNSLILADFSRRTMRRVTDAQPRWWSFLPGGKRIVGERTRGVAYDLEHGFEWTFGSPGSEWEFFAAVPGDADRFILSQATGRTNDLYWVTLPSSLKVP